MAGFLLSWDYLGLQVVLSSFSWKNTALAGERRWTSTFSDSSQSLYMHYVFHICAQYIYSGEKVFSWHHNGMSVSPLVFAHRCLMVLQNIHTILLLLPACALWATYTSPFRSCWLEPITWIIITIMSDTHRELKISDDECAASDLLRLWTRTRIRDSALGNGMHLNPQVRQAFVKLS